MAAQWQGLEGVKAALDRKSKMLPRKIRNAVRRGATLQTRALKSNLKRKRTGLTGKSIGNKVTEKPGRVTAISGIRRGFKVRVTKTMGNRLEGVRITKKGEKGIKLKSAAGIKEGAVLDANRVGHLIDGGTKERKHKSGKSVGRMPASPFRIPAYKQTEAQVRQMIADAAKEAVRA